MNREEFDDEDVFVFPDELEDDLDNQDNSIVNLNENADVQPVESTTDEATVQTEEPTYEEATAQAVEPTYEEATVQAVEPTYEEATVQPVEPAYEEATVQPVEPTYEEVTVQPEESKYEEATVQPVKPIEDESYVNENPNAQVNLMKGEEEEIHHVEDASSEKITDNKSLMFVLVIGLVILVAIFVLPMLLY